MRIDAAASSDTMSRVGSISYGAAMNKLLAIATSGSGKEKLEIAGVDAVSAASKMSDAPALAERINQWLAARLQN